MNKPTPYRKRSKGSVFCLSNFQEEAHRSAVDAVKVQIEDAVAALELRVKSAVLKRQSIERITGYLDLPGDIPDQKHHAKRHNAAERRHHDNEYQIIKQWHGIHDVSMIAQDLRIPEQHGLCIGFTTLRHKLLRAAQRIIFFRILLHTDFISP